MVQTAGSSKRSSDVPEQFYGYAIQLPRMAAHLLEADVGAHVCLEHIDDVVTIGPSGDLELEQSKSSFTANPVSDRAVPFWKTLSNWVDVVRAKRVDAERTRFRLHVAQSRECGPLIAMLRDATTEAAVLSAIEAARAEFWGAGPHYADRASVPPSVSEFIENVFTAPVEILTTIVKRLGIDAGTGDSIEDVRRGLRKQLVSADQVDELGKYMLGWLKERVHALIEAAETVIVARDDFFAAMLTYVRKHDRIFQLSPWATEPSADAIDQELQAKVYVRQLDLIEADADDKIHAAADYLKSIVDRTRWSARGDVEPSSFKAFEENLQQQWKARQKEVSIEHGQHPDVTRGKLLYARCQQYEAKLQNMEPSYYFTSGCFHALAEELKVGWHPQFQVHFAATAGKKAS